MGSSECLTSGDLNLRLIFWYKLTEKLVSMDSLRHRTQQKAKGDGGVGFALTAAVLGPGWD